MKDRNRNSLHHTETLSGLCTRHKVEMPPFGIEGLQTLLFHYAAKKLTIVQFLPGDGTGREEPGFGSDMRLRAEMVESGAHGQGIARGVDKGDIDSSTIIVQAWAVKGVGDIDIIRCALHQMEHTVLHRNRTHSIEDEQREVGPLATQRLLGGHNLLSQRGKEEGMVEVGIEHLTNKIVGGSIDQMDLDGGVEGLNIHQTEGKKTPFGSSIVGTLARRGVEIGIV